MLIVRTLAALIFGMWCHMAHTDLQMRSKTVSGLVQTVFSLPTFTLVSCLFILVGEQMKRDLDG